MDSIEDTLHYVILILYLPLEHTILTSLSCVHTTAAPFLCVGQKSKESSFPVQLTPSNHTIKY